MRTYADILAGITAALRRPNSPVPEESPWDSFAEDFEAELSKAMTAQPEDEFAAIARRMREIAAEQG